jgi:hypothetical protein
MVVERSKNCTSSAGSVGVVAKRTLPPKRTETAKSEREIFIVKQNI